MLWITGKTSVHTRKLINFCSSERLWFTPYLFAEHLRPRVQVPVGMFAKETDKSLRVNQVFSLVWFFSHATYFFLDPTVFVLHVVFLFSLLEEEIAVLVGFVCVSFLRKDLQREHHLLLNIQHLFECWHPFLKKGCLTFFDLLKPTHTSKSHWVDRVLVGHIELLTQVKLGTSAYFSPICL